MGYLANEEHEGLWRTGNWAETPSRAPGALEAPLSASILVVDDNPKNLVALEAILEPLGHRLVKASSGDEALRHLLSEEFAVILMDVQMPDLDGLETARIIKQRERCRHIPIVFLTAINKEQSSIFEGYATGAVDYLLKPFDPEILRSKVSVFIDLFRQKKLIKQQEAMLRMRERDAFERKSELRFRSLIDAMPQCMWAARADGRFYYSNKAWVEYSGQEGDPAEEIPFLGLLHLDEQERVRAAWRSALENGLAFEVQARFRRRDGVYRWHLGRAAPERDEGGRIVGWIITATDIDDQKRAEELEHAAREQAERANRMKDDFLATISHELRTPLNAIVGWTQILRTGKLDGERAARALLTIARNAELQTHLIQDILDVSRIVAGKLRIEPDIIDLVAVVQAAVDVVRPAAEAKEITLESLLPSEERIMGDADRLQQVIWNLLSNAVKFTPKGGRIEVELARLAEKIEIRVSDTGEGIRPEFLPRVFERFSQADVSMTRKHGGLGLGLAIVHHLVDLHGGDVRAESLGEGKGSTFTVELPAPPRLALCPVLVEERDEDQHEGEESNQVQEGA